MNELAIELHEAAMVLENDGDFYAKYTRLTDCQASTRRDTINSALVRNKIDEVAMTRASGLGVTDLREHLRRYLDDVWEMPAPADVATCAVVQRWKELKFWEDSVKYPPVPAPQAEAPPAGNGKSVQLPDDIELQTIDGVDWHVTRIPDGSVMYSMTTACKVWDAFGKASGMEYRRQARDWSSAAKPAFTGSNPYRWKPEFTFKLLEQEASEAALHNLPKTKPKPKPTSSGDDPWSYSPECVGGYDNTGAIAAMQRGDQVQRWSPVEKCWVDITATRFPPDQRYRWMPPTKFRELMDSFQKWKDDVRTIATGVDNLTSSSIWKDHAQDSLAYINNLLETQAKETIMNHAINTAAIVITTKTLVNGVDIATLADSGIYDLIAKQEAAVADLEKIDNKPKKLVNEIAKRKAGIQALVDYLDSKEPADKADDNGANASA